jgi:EmrB/QacA subfamily drug resistance transporter
MENPTLPRGFGRLLAALALVNLLGAMDISIVATALPIVVGEFHQTQNMSWIIVGYSLANAIMVPVYGKLADKFGASRLFGWAVWEFLFASMLCGLAPNFYVLAIARLLQGLGGGGLAFLPYALISEMVPERSRPKYLAPLASVWSIAAVAGPVVGGILTDALGWRWIFFINVPLGILALLLAAGVLPKREPRHSDKLFDQSTYWLFAVTAVLLVLAVRDWASSALTGVNDQLIWLGLAAAVAMGLFFWRSLASNNPVIPLRVLGNRGSVTMLAMGTIAGTSIFSITGFVPTLLQMGFNLPATIAGLGLVPMVIGMLVTSLTFSRRVHKTGRWHRLPVVGSLVAAAGMFLAYFYIDAWNGWFVVFALAIVAAGYGVWAQLTLTIVQSFSKAKVFGAVTATVNVSRDLTGSVVATVAGGLFGVRVIQSLTSVALPPGVHPGAVKPSQLAHLDATTHLAVNHAYISGFQPVFLNSAIAYLAVFVLALTLPRQDLKATHS